MSVCPFAIQRLIPPGPNDPPITPRLAILHVAATRAGSLWGYFTHRSGGIESHFYVRLDGTIEQYRDTSWQADANYLANDFAVSVESAGLGGGRWNRRQRKAIKRLLLWLHEVDGIPLHKPHRWDGHGVGYHTQFGAPGKWTPYAKTCPGPQRISQYRTWLVPWMAKVTRPVPPPPPERLQIITANLWKDNPAIEADLAVLAATRAHIIGCQEAARFTRLLRNVEGYQWVVVPGESQTAGVLVRDDVEVVEHGFRQISEAVGISPARGAQWVVYKWHGILRAHVNTHWNSHVQLGAATPRTLPRVREYIKGTWAVTALVSELKAQGYPVTVTGDLNWSYTAQRRQWWYAPRQVFGRLGFVAQFAAATNPWPRPKGDRREIEYVFYEPSDLTLVAQRFVEGEHSDHPWHLCEFEEA